ncbi:MAG: ABC transporter ATP-binding protein [Thermoprotei archaeon]|nr:MAG: ABC transporter ATP-binding protein [Thermoprotei archaeon]
MIELRNVWFSYFEDEYVLRDVNLSFEKGITIIMGPNGSGKTTLLKVASLIYKATKGQVTVNGIDYWSLSEGERLKIRRRIVYVHEKPTLLRGSALENVAYGLTIRGIKETEARESALEVMSELGIAHLANRRDVNRLSAGEKQLIAIARALVLNPDYLFLDEPLAHLHLTKRKNIVELLEKLKSKTTIVISSHDPIPLLTIADRIVILEEGKITHIGSPKELLEELYT